jgi:hypothetical protein
MSSFNEIEFSGQISKKNAQIPYLIKIHPMGAELFNADGHT